MILDSLFEIDWKYLSAIERAILAPLSELSNVILILTGRGPEYNWSTARFRAQPPYILKPFAEEYNPASDTNYISRQLYEQVFVQSAVTHTNQEEIVEKIKQSTMGYPLNNILIAQALIDPAAWDACGEKLFEPYPTLTEDDKNAIKALAILHPAARFREEEIEELAPITAGKKLSGSIIRKQLYASNIMSWDRGGWLIEEAVTDFFRAQLVFDPHIKKRHQELHTQALSMYERWQNEEQNPQAYKQEISYHRDRVSA